MRRQRQQIRLFKRRLPLLHPARRVPLAEDAKLCDKQPPFSVLRANPHGFCARVHRRIRRQKRTVRLRDGLPCARRIPRLHIERRRVVVKLHIHAADGVLRLDLHIGRAVRGRRPVRPIIPVRHAAERLFAHAGKSASVGHLLRRLRKGRGRKRQQRRQHPNQFSHAFPPFFALPPMIPQFSRKIKFVPCFGFIPMV